MQLLPQHFQLQGLRAEMLAAHFAQSANPWFWGLSHLKLDPAALTAGLVRVQALEAILPDGLAVSLQPGRGSVLELDVGPAIAASATASTTVFLAITPLGRNGQVLPLRGRLQSEVGDAVPDLASGEHPEPILVWRPAARLVTESSRADSVCLPLLRIAKDVGGYVRQPYVAPTPRILPESDLGRAVAELCARAREKCLFLAGRLRQAEQTGSTDDRAEIRRQLAALWARLPEVEAALNSRIAAPDQLHGLLAGMAGGWSALDPLAGVPAFAPLDYLDLKRGYDEVLGWLDVTLERVRVGYRCLPFQPLELGFAIQLPDARTQRQRLVIGLRMPAGAGEQDAANWLGQAIIASQSRISTLARQRMSGLPQQPMSRAEQLAYGVGEDTRLFVIQAAGEWFDPEQPLCLVVPGRATHASPWQAVLFITQDSETA